MDLPMATRNLSSRPRRARRLAAWLLVCGLALLGGCDLPKDLVDQVDEDPSAPAAKTAAASKSGNRLAKETSPYLLMHAKNPVDWHPWGPEALERAKQSGKPIFLSVGYSSCHWCHLMERRVFSHPEIARYLNEHFVCIKVDREERPDIDDVYMTALTIYYQQLNLPMSGGWPLTMFLTPDARPMGGGTYFPPFDEEGQPGFFTLVKGVAEKWAANRAQMERSADLLSKNMQTVTRFAASLRPPALDAALVDPVVERLAAGFDPQYGGFGYDVDNPDRPKFPVPVKLALLQAEAVKRNNKTAEQMLVLTLDRMSEGGLYDHLGGGFHRYSADRQWRVPHFEKMLYDNAQLAEIYAEAFHHTGDVRYRDVAEGTIAFVLRDLADPEGGFYSALDSDTNEIEGKHYVWTRRDLAAALSPEETQLVETVYGMQGEPHFEHGFVLAISRPFDEVARDWRLTTTDLEGHLERIRRKLLAARQKRPAPFRDDKVLTSWNGLMIRALARSGQLLKRRDYIQSAERAATFVLKNLRDERGRLLHAYRQRQARVPAYLDDYAYLVDGLLSLAEATGDTKWTNAAIRLTDQQLSLFWDEQDTGCFFTAADDASLLVRMKPAYDAVLPSGNSVTVRNLNRLMQASSAGAYRQKAEETLTLFAPLIETNPAAVANMALALREYLEATQSGSQNGPSASRQPRKRDPNLQVIGDQKPVEESVTAKVYFATDRLPAGSSGKLLVLLTIQPGWHINANPAGEDLDPTTVALKSKAAVKAGTIRYPQGAKFKMSDGTEMPVYEKEVGIIVPLDIPAEAGGKDDELQIQIDYQACFKEIKCLPRPRCS